MKTMIWKELRENARWAALGGFCLALAETFALSLQHAQLGGYDGLTLSSSAFLMVSAFGCSAIGAALGALQILPELRRDQWASLLHRPVSRDVIFFGKVAAGLLLLTLSTGVPLLLSIVNVALPGRFAAPFVPSLAQPAVSDIALGWTFYFTAVLLGLHQGRWLGSRGAIAASPVAILVLHLSSGWPFSLPLLAAAALALAGWGAMRGSLVVRPWISRLALGVVAFVGLETIVLTIVSLGHGSRESLIIWYFYSNFQIAGDGKVFIWKPDDHGRGQLTDPEGHVVTDEKYLGNDSEHATLQPQFLANRRLARGHVYERNSRDSYQFVSVAWGSYDGPELWYLITGPQSHFEGYDRLSRRRIGICDADGFKGPTAAVHPFATSPGGEMIQSRSYLTWIGSEFCAIDFTERRVTPLIDVGNDTIYGAGEVPVRSENRRYVLALNDGIQVADTKGAPLFKIPYAYDPARWPLLSMTATEDLDRLFVEYGSFGQQTETHLEVLDGQGHRVAQYFTSRTLPIGTHESWFARWVDALGSSLATLLINHKYGEGIFEISAYAYFVQKLPAALPGDLRGLIGLWLGFAVILEVVACVWARRAGLSMPRLAIWMALTLVFGIAGFFAYRLSSIWPTSVRCPRCARQRPAQALTCPHCQAAWEAAPVNGTEIFEPV